MGQIKNSFLLFSNFLSILVKRLDFVLSSGFAIISGVMWMSDPIAWDFDNVKGGNHHLCQRAPFRGALSIVPRSCKYSVNGMSMFNSC